MENSIECKNASNKRNMDWNNNAEKLNNWNKNAKRNTNKHCDFTHRPKSNKCFHFQWKHWKMLISVKCSKHHQNHRKLTQIYTNIHFGYFRNVLFRCCYRFTVRRHHEVASTNIHQLHSFDKCKFKYWKSL